MDRRITVTLVLAILAVSCMIVVMTDDSEGSTSERVSYVNVFRGEFTIPDLRPYGEDYIPFSSNQLYFIDDSKNDQIMERYLDDQSVDVKEDDRERILEIGRSGGSDQTVNLYYVTKYQSGNLWWAGQESDPEWVLEAYNTMSFFVKSGNTLEFTLISCVNNFGEEEDVYWEDEMWNYHYAEPSLEIETNKSGEIALNIDHSGLYCDVVYDVTGNSEPNGSATLFIVVCAAITVIVFALLAMAAIKPKWSK